MNMSMKAIQQLVQYCELKWSVLCGDLQVSFHQKLTSFNINFCLSMCSVFSLQAIGANVSGMVGYGDAEPFPLKWGEVIPLHFLHPSLPTTAQTLIISQPNRRYTQSVEMIPELLSLGVSPPNNEQ